MEINEGVFILSVNGVFKHLPVNYHYFMIWLWLFSVTMTLLVAPIEFFFRYMLICR